MEDNKNEHIKIMDIDPYLKPYEKDINLRMGSYTSSKKKLLGYNQDFKSFANGELYYGFHLIDGGWIYREWAPNADALYLIGDFNYWDPHTHPLQKIENGNWEIFLPGVQALKHMSRVKVRVVAKGISRDRIPLYIKRTVQDHDTHDFAGQIWQPDHDFKWQDSEFHVKSEESLFIYEAHVGMAQEKEGIGTFNEFTENILPRIKADGYNTLQLMAIMQHPYYASFGYQVSNFYAVSSWFGTPDDLKKLINTAHQMGIAVLLDLVHSHSIKNIAEGINEFDGTDYQFFHTGVKGNHPAWGTKLFNYGKPEVIHFLLSNIKFWLEEYHFDGYRFDGVSSMLYHHQGLGVAFTDYSKYFSMETDIEAITYLQFANDLIREVNPTAVTIAEDMSGMPGMCIPVSFGGLGFDYRLSMGVPDLWVKILKELPDEKWSMNQLWYELTSRRPMEKNIGYSESHDQALVGDKTLMFRLADKEMYSHMLKDDDNLIINRAIEMDKLIKFITITLGGEGYLNFMGNEFGHPEWIDFPREGNNWSYKYARRQWSLMENQDLKYEYLSNFDREMIKFIKYNNVLSSSDVQNLWTDEKFKLLALKKNGFVFLFNFNPSCSFPKYELPTSENGDYKVVFNSDELMFGGQSRIDTNYIYHSKVLSHKDNKTGIIINTPSRTVLVLKKIDNNTH
ncbi:alpha amylase C-terminal domain-containing protein [Clostridium estertheticum]|uniref:alpha-amylase family glycosyl hydrolase n=1 Tax=Clostridium estertheticum TaxID=238834 RepID=UPI001CF446A8|nr:alpha-amylase family glycosyl hydrolase [Clostridium estertheticum]MCB2306892.1 alpha amylase C-terminal domain-containing protein [Clostridium estertheticum]MCB2345319.1 alpha amylase C-terminal domain-containing protein [Clostridium estertheticum]MCB2350398.1 alpha amylase C-terminal domain-containing protein [Clostridium estertheticum]WAG45208.1 alpha amylase C-terminal domain-containing protein [Clostridium estertheticum]